MKSSLWMVSALAIMWAPCVTARRATDYVTVENGIFRQCGRPWAPYGVFYRPVSSMVTAGPERDWVAHYDPVEVETDLRLMKQMGFNTIRIMASTYYHADHPKVDWSTFPTPQTSYKARLHDLLDRLKRHGMKAQVYVHLYPEGGRWVLPLFDFVDDPVKRAQSLQMARKFITECDLARRPEVLAWELDWEPHVGDQDVRNGRKWPGHVTPIKLWNRWIVDQYGSVDAANRCWGYLGPMVDTPEGPLVSAPSDDELFGDGVWTRKSVAYRRFIEELINKRYALLRDVFREIAPHHLLTAQRICLMGKVPHNRNLPYPVRHTTAFLDYTGYTFSPHTTWGLFDEEVYRNDPIRFWSQGFGVRYNRMNKPSIFMEFGASTYNPNLIDDVALQERIQALHYERMQEIATMFGADGALAWWWIGRRPMYDGDPEVSDWGILRPDRSEKPVTEVIRAWSGRMRNPPEFRADGITTVNEYAHADEADVYIGGARAFARLLKDGKRPDVRTLDQGADSRTCSLRCLCSALSHRIGPRRALSAAFGPFRAWSAGTWRAVEYGALAPRDKDMQWRLRVEIGNTGEARWLDRQTAEGKSGTVGLRWRAGDRSGFVPVTACVEPNHTCFLSVSLPADLPAGTSVTLQMEAMERTVFGELFRCVLR